MKSDMIGRMGQAGPVPVLIFLFTFGYTLFEAARVATIEDAVCRYQSLDNIANCRRDRDAQARIASLNGWVDFATYTQGILVTMPNTWLGQRIDKYHLLMVGSITSILSMLYFYATCHLSGNRVLPLNMIIFFHLFEVVGGGILMTYVLLNSLLAAQTTVESRASVFYIMGTVLIFARAGGTAICGVFLQFWPRAVGPTAILTYLVCIPVILLFRGGPTNTPASISISTSARPEHESELALPGESSRVGLLDDNDQDNDDTAKPTVLPLNAPSTIKKWLFRVLPSYHTLLSNPVFKYGLLFHALTTMGTDVQMIQPQWTVNRFKWSYSAVAYVNLYTALIVLLVLAGLPVLSSHLLTRLKSPQKMEVFILTASIGIRVVGTAAMGAAPSRGTFLLATAIQALSGGALDTFKAFLTGFCSAGHVAELYAAMTLVETGMHVIGSRMWAQVLIVSLDLDGLSMGLPFWTSTGFSLSAMLLVWVMSGYKRSAAATAPASSSTFVEQETEV